MTVPARARRRSLYRAGTLHQASQTILADGRPIVADGGHATPNGVTSAPGMPAPGGRSIDEAVVAVRSRSAMMVT
ncbi:MAG: hypothetical protein IVW52_11970 [Acidimicrobiales bacterium]|nr:hypothetical protein [Acidimicrobiales bacterium]